MKKDHFSFESKPMNAAQAIMSGAYNANDGSQENVQKWEDLEGLYKACAETLIVANKSVVELFKIPGIIENISNTQETKIAILGLDKDIKHFSEKLSAIHSEHIGKVGKVKDEDELSSCIQIFEKYHDFQLTYQSVIIPTVLQLSEEVGKAAQQMKNLTDAQNPNVTTDVEVKAKTEETPIIVKEETND